MLLEVLPIVGQMLVNAIKTTAAIKATKLSNHQDKHIKALRFAAGDSLFAVDNDLFPMADDLLFL